MTQLTFTQCQDRIEEKLKEVNGKAELSSLAGEIAVEVLAVHNTIPDAERRVDADLFKGDRFYAIPDGALNLIPSLATAAFAVITGNLAGALPELVGILYRYRTLQVVLDGDEAAVISVLRAAQKAKLGPLSPAEIADRLKAGGLRLQRPLKQVFAGIRAKETADVTLANESGGRWTIGNV